MSDPSLTDPDGSGVVHAAPAPCARCAAASITTAADSSDFSERLCGPCGHGWLLKVMGYWDSSLATFVGSGTADQANEHAQAIAERQAAEAAEAAQRERRARLAREARDNRDAKAEAEKITRAKRCAEIVRSTPGIDAVALAAALGVSRTTLGRITKLATDQGLIERSGYGPGSGYRALTRV